MPQPAPEAEQAFGMACYLTDTPGIGGHLRGEPEDFQVIELGEGPKPDERGRFTAARVRLKNWETNRFAGRASRDLNIKRNFVAFAGMKDKRAVTEQWFTFKCPENRLANLQGLQDVEILESHMTQRATYAGAHEGNRFILRVRDSSGDPADTVAQIAAEGGVPHFFGPQRFGNAVRPVTHLMGKAIVAGDLKEAVRLYCGNPMEGEREDTFAARAHFQDTGDAEATLEILPRNLDFEAGILQRLVKDPENWRWALQSLPRNLRSLFVHAHQSWVFNHILSARIAAGMGLREAHIGDRVMGLEEDGTKTHLVTSANQARVQDEINRGRAVITAPLPGLNQPAAEGEPGELEIKVMQDLGIEPADFRCREMPDVASEGRRRSVLQHVHDLTLQTLEGDPVLSFGLGRGAYATTVMREVMKSDDVGVY